MATRIHIILDQAEKERFRRQAEREGKSLAAWLREAAREKLAEDDQRARLDTVEALRAFFAACDRRETEAEPDWDEQKKLIERSVRSGCGDT